jgi:hypothetical protein
MHQHNAVDKKYSMRTFNDMRYRAGTVGQYYARLMMKETLWLCLNSSLVILTNAR